MRQNSALCAVASIYPIICSRTNERSPGIDSVTGLDVTTWNLAGGVEGGYKIFFASTKSGTVYSCHDDGNDLQALITDLTQPNDVM